MNWSYGIITVPGRASDLLPRTLASLAKAGFDKPRLFVDDCSYTRFADAYEMLDLEVTPRWPQIGVPSRFRRNRPGFSNLANWILGIVELYLRNPFADKYAIFEDDLVTYLNLRQYLDQCHYPERGYWNLYTFPQNLELANGRHGWYPSNQMGRGAVGLVFSRDALVTLFTSDYLVRLPYTEQRGWKSLDGAIVTAFKKAGWMEFVHNPSLVQHVGTVSAMHNHSHLQANSFRGENYDALELLCTETATAH